MPWCVPVRSFPTAASMLRALLSGSRSVLAPDIATPETFEAALIAARTIALSDPAVGGSAGIYLRDLFGRMGLAESIAAKTVPHKSGVAAADAVGRGEAELAITFIPELLQGKGSRILSALPPPYDHVTAYAAG